MFDGKHLSAREGADHAVRNNVHQEVEEPVLLGRLCVSADRRTVNFRRVDVHPAAGLEDVAHDQTDDKRKRRSNFELHHGFHAHPPGLVNIVHQAFARDTPAFMPGRDSAAREACPAPAEIVLSMLNE